MPHLNSVFKNNKYTIYQTLQFFLDVKLGLRLKIHCIDYSVMECALNYYNINCKCFASTCSHKKKTPKKLCIYTKDINRHCITL